jgi:hypothetical protein
MKKVTQLKIGPVALLVLLAPTQPTADGGATGTISCSTRRPS